jgi:hypothetical protein
MRRSRRKRPLTARRLGLRDLPKAWRGATLEQLINSAENVVDQSEAIGGSNDPRLPAARKILRLKEELILEGRWI